MKSRVTNKHNKHHEAPRPRVLLSFDPGLRGCGCALWFGGRLAWCGFPRVDSKTRGPTQWRAMGSHVFWTLDSVPGPPVDTIITEVPEVYQRTTARQGNDLLQLAGVVGALVALYPGARLAQVIPRHWKGQVSKAVTARVVRDALDADETGRAIHDMAKVPKSLQHNVTDALGIGLFHLGR